MEKIYVATENLDEVLPEQETTNKIFSFLKSSRNLLDKSDKAQELAELLNLPSTDDLNHKQKAVESLYALNHLYQSILSKVFLILNWLGWLFLIPVVMSVIWLWCDLIHGKKKITTIFLILIAVGANWISYVTINEYLDIYFTQITL